jgi:hypothetical protein
LLDLLFLTGCRVSAVVGACVGHLEPDGVEQYLHVAEKSGTEGRKILLDATTEVYFVRKEEDAVVAARCTQIRLTGRKSE